MPSPKHVYRELKPENRPISASAPATQIIEKWLCLPLNIIEWLGFYIIVKPLNGVLRHLDGLSYRLEGTVLRTLLQHTLFPVTILFALFVGFEMVEQGISLESVGVLVALPFIFGAFLAPLERLLPYSRNWLEGGNDITVDLMMFASGAFWRAASAFLLKLLFIAGLVEVLEEYGHGLWPSQLPDVVEVFLFILFKDFFRYWIHRAMHEVPFLWRFHAAHHSVERLYWMNGIRAHPMEVIGQAVVYALPFALLQPSAEIMMIALLMQLAIGIFQHANLDLKLGYWEYIFSIGDNHRYHHYPNKEIGDSNYGGEFIVFDILFGTFHKVKGERPHDRIGIGTAPNYPLTMAGLLIAPFLPDQKVFGPARPEAGTGEQDRTQAQPTLPDAARQS